MRVMRRFLVAILIAALVGVCIPSGVLAGGVLAQPWMFINDGLYGTEVTYLTLMRSGALLCGTSHMGPWVSDDQGRAWRRSDSGLLNLGTPAVPQYARIMQIVQSPVDDTRVYLACDPGIWTSGDAGKTWSALGSSMAKRRINCLAVDAHIPALLLAGTDDGIWQSVDGGQSWIARNAGMSGMSVLEIVPDTGVRDVWFARTGTGMFKSLDGGTSWRGISPVLAGRPVTAFAQDARRPETLYAGTSTGLWRTFDGGGTWVQVRSLAGSPSVVALAIDNFDSNLIGLIARQGVAVSRDSGESWQWTYGSKIGTDITVGIWTRKGDMTTVMAADGRGVSEITGGSREERVSNLGFVDVKAIGWDSHYGRLYAVRDSGLFVSDFNTPWDRVSRDLGNSMVFTLATDGAHPQLMYAASEYGILRSSDAGTTWMQLTETRGIAQGRIQAVALDPRDTRVLFAGNDTGLWRSKPVEYDMPWDAVGPRISDRIVGIATSQASPDSLYLLTATSLWKTADHCNTWAQIVSALPSKATPLCIAVSPSDALLVCLGFADGAYLSSDGGTNWRQATRDLAGAVVNSLAFAGSNRLTAGTSMGVAWTMLVRDDIAPVLTVSSPADRAVVSQPQVLVTGSASDAGGIGQVTVNGVPVTLSVTGGFSVPLSLTVGDNAIQITAIDVAGNTTSVTLHLSYVLPRTILTLRVGSKTMIVSDGRSIPLDAAPTIIRSRTMIPIRSIVETLGGTVGWNAPTQTVSVQLGTHQLLLVLGSPTGVVDGRKVPIDAGDANIVPAIVAGRTVLPLRFVAESLGSRVDWLAATSTITITYPAP